MRTLCFKYLLSLTSIVSVVTTRTIKAITLTDFRLFPANSTVVGNIDPRFSLTFQFDGPTFLTTPCLMNAVYAMQKLAFGNFTDQVEPLTYALPDFSTVSVVTEATTTSDTIERRFLIWGIWKGIFYMMDNYQFQNALFTLHWDGAAVGYVIFANSAERLGSQWSNVTHVSRRSRVRSLSYASTGALPHKFSNMDLTLYADDHQLEVSLALTGQTLTIFELFITVLSGLAYVAEIPDSQRVENFSLSPARYDVTLSIADESEQLPVNAPVLEARWIIMALGLIPRYMVERSDFREVVLEMEVDGQPVGQGYIERGRR